MARNRFATFGTVWTFKTRRFRVSLELTRDSSFQYDGEDSNGETQAALDRGDFVAFNSFISVEFDGELIACNSLCGSVYQADSVADFYTDHRDSNPMNRNCEAMRAVHGARTVICHYFPDMVREAISEARDEMQARKSEAARLPYIRGGA
jgi:hypothetical protein